MAILDVPNNISHKDLSNFTVSLQEAAFAGYSLAQFEKCRLEVFAVYDQSTWGLHTLCNHGTELIFLITLHYTMQHAMSLQL